MADEDGQLAFTDVPSPGRIGLGAIEVQDVVLHLEQHAQVASGLDQRLFHRLVRAAEHGRAAEGQGEQARGLAFDHAEVVRQGDIGLGLQRHVQHLAFDHPQHLEQQPARRPLARLRRRLEPLHQQDGHGDHGVAEVDRLGRPEARPDRELAAAHAVAVLHIVVDQGGVVQHLAGGPEGCDLGRVGAQGVGHQDRQDGAQPLAAGGELVVGHLAQDRAVLAGEGRHQRHLRLDRRPPAPGQGVEARSQRRLNLGHRLVPPGGGERAFPGEPNPCRALISGRPPRRETA